MRSKHEKYSTNNFISRYLVKNFYSAIGDLYSSLSFVNSYIELGCGEGRVTKYLQNIKKTDSCKAIDINPKEVEDAKILLPHCDIKVESIYNISEPDSAFDIVVCCEVLEHLDDPDKAIAEIYRISGKYIIISVPREPIWKVMNMMRLHYFKNLGNTPGHINHWSRKAFMKYVDYYFKIITVKTPIPWTMILGLKR